VADKYIRNNAGVLTETEATVTSAGAGNAGDIVALDSNGKLDNSVMPVGIGADTAQIEASENISASELVNVYENAGESNIRKADATSAGKEASGYVLESVTSGQPGTVYFEQIITGLSGLTPGAKYYLSTTPGAITTTPPSGSGNVVQYIGRALSETTLQFQPGPPVVLA